MAGIKKIFSDFTQKNCTQGCSELKAANAVERRGEGYGVGRITKYVFFFGKKNIRQTLTIYRMTLDKYFEFTELLYKTTSILPNEHLRFTEWM